MLQSNGVIGMERMAATTLPCGKESSRILEIEFSPRIYHQALSFSLKKLNRRDRWKIIRLLTENLVSPEGMCRAVAESELSFGGKSLCQLLCPLEY